MAQDQRIRWALHEDADVRDALDRPKITGVGIDTDGRVILAVMTRRDGVVEPDPATWVTMPDTAAESLGYHLQSAAEVSRQQRRP